MVAVWRPFSRAFTANFADSVLSAYTGLPLWLSSVAFPFWFWLVCCFASAMRLSKSGFCAKYFLMASSSVGDETAGLAGGMGTFFFGGMRDSLATKERQRLLI